MSKLTIDLKKVAIPKDFKSKFDGKTFEARMPDQEMVGATDKLKTPANLEKDEKLKILLKDHKPIKDLLFPVLEQADIDSDIDELGTHVMEVKFQGNATFKAKLQLLSSTGAETRIVLTDEPRKLGAHPASVKLENLSNAAGSGCPAPDDLAHLLKQMALVSSYSWSGKQGTGNGWTPQFSGHYTHDSPDIKGHKSYVDEPSQKTGSMWRLRFNTEYVEKSDQLRVKIHSVQLDRHK